MKLFIGDRTTEIVFCLLNTAKTPEPPMPPGSEVLLPHMPNVGVGKPGATRPTEEREDTAVSS